MSEKFDVIVIGSGPGGYVAAIRAAQKGLKTGIVEKDIKLGGTCLNVGCIPSKALLQSSELYYEVLHAAKDNGIVIDSSTVDFNQMMTRKNQVVKSLVDGVAGLIKKNQITRFEGVASFESTEKIKIHSITEIKEIEAKYFIIATGSEPIQLPFLPFDEKRVMSSTGALNLAKIPKKLVVIGAGVIGVEIASVYSRLGSEVLIIEMLDHICPGLDKGIGRLFTQILKKQGLQFLLSTQVLKANVEEEHVTLTINHESKEEEIQGDSVLVGVGRKPYTANLGLEKIGIQVSSKGFIPVDGNFRTQVPTIFAIGDVVEGPMLAHRASEEGVAVAEFLAGHSSHVNYLTIPSVIYTSPEVASVGLTEEEAKQAGLSIKVGSFPFKGNPRARCSGHDEGVVKVIGEEKTGKVIGLHILCSHASEMIAEGVVAISKGMTLSDLAFAAHPHPTLTEAVKEAALAALDKPIHI